jgi:hypothetical protein
MENMEHKVEALVDRAKHLALHEPPKEAHTVDRFHSTVDDHIQKIYKSLRKDAPTTDYFLKEIQHDSSAPVPTGKEAVADPLASVDAFREYMKDENSCAMAPEDGLDISAPLCDYFISSSHNTYLTGNQLYSDAAASAYTSVSIVIIASKFIANLLTGPSTRVQIRRDRCLGWRAINARLKRRRDKQ